MTKPTPGSFLKDPRTVLALSIISGLGGALVLGLSLEQVIQQITYLREYTLWQLVWPFLVLALSLIINTYCVVMCFKIIHMGFRIATLVFCFIIPPIIEIIDIGFRAIAFITELTTVYQF